MNKLQAKSSSLKVNSSVLLLEGNEIIDLYTIDIAKLLITAKLDYNLTNTLLGSKSASDIGADDAFKFRFHNSIKIFNGNTNIVFAGKTYFAAPITAEGFEMATRGSPPTPKLSMAIRGDGNVAVEGAFRNFKLFLRDFDDLSGAKVTRIRTFSRHLDRGTWYADAVNSVLFDQNYPPPSNYDADPNAIISNEVYYIDRKSLEDKNTLEFELSTILDLQGVKIPLRIIAENACSWQYRGEGCCYENRARRITKTHGANTIMPINAPPVANEKNRVFGRTGDEFAGTTFNDKNHWTTGTSYAKGDVVHVTVDDVNYYFVARGASLNIPPPNGDFWVQDQCSKTIDGCKIRWGAAGKAIAIANNGYVNEALRFGGFPGVMKRGS